MIEAVMFWNEPNNKSHWDFEIDPEWTLFGEMAIAASQAIKAENGRMPCVLGGISPIDPLFIRRLTGYGVMDHMDVVALHGFPLDWNLWQIHDWPAKVDEIRAVCGAVSKPVNVLARPGLTVAEIAAAGARRISVGGSLAWVAVNAMVEAAQRMRDEGDFSAFAAPSRAAALLRPGA